MLMLSRETQTKNAKRLQLRWFAFHFAIPRQTELAFIKVRARIGYPSHHKDLEGMGAIPIIRSPRAEGDIR